MSQLWRGRRPPEGEVTIQARRTAYCRCWQPPSWTGGTVELRRCPHLKDVEASIRILQALGCRAEWQGDT